MPRVIVTAKVEDAAAWEKGFRTHGDLFREQTATAMHFTVTNENEVAIQFARSRCGWPAFHVLVHWGGRMSAPGG